MKKNFKLFAVSAAVLLTAGALASCGEGGSGPSFTDEYSGKLTYSGPESQEKWANCSLSGCWVSSIAGVKGAKPPSRRAKGGAVSEGGKPSDARGSARRFAIIKPLCIKAKTRYNT